jgi:ribosome-binding protein aMBF1 (putative translation factor)
MKKNSNITTLDEHLNTAYGKQGTDKRDEFERRYASFKLGVMIRDARKKANMTQAELAEKAQTKRSYISRIESDASDIRLSTLMRIIELGLGGKLELNINI